MCGSKMAAKLYLVLATCFVACIAEDVQVVPFKPCPGEPNTACTMHEVRITPCSRLPCVVRLGQYSNMKFDFTPDFNATKLKNYLGTTLNGNEVKLDSLDEDAACSNTACPAVQGQKQTYSFDLHAGAKWPRGLYTITWKVWNAENKDQICCFLSEIKLKK